MTTEVSGPALADAIRARYPDAVTGAAIDWVEVTPERLLDVCRFLHDDGAWMFRQLCSVTAVDWLTRFDMVYHLLSVHTNQRAVLKAALPDRESPVIDKLVSHIFPMSRVQEAFEVSASHDTAKILLHPWE